MCRLIQNKFENNCSGVWEIKNNLGIIATKCGKLKYNGGHVNELDIYNEDTESESAQWRSQIAKTLHSVQPSLNTSAGLT